MVHYSPLSNKTSLASSPRSNSTTGFKVYGSVFKVSSRYQFLHALGKGSYGIVCAAKDCETGQCVAIKKVSPMTRRTADAKHTLREVMLLQHLGKHPNVISIHNLLANFKDDELYIVMDLMDTDMHRVIQSSQPLSDAHAKYFLHQLLRGVKYLHDNGVLHRDLKPGNLLLSKNCQLKIADFGLARKIPRTSGSIFERPRSAPAASMKSNSPEQPPMTEHVVTRWYRAPELMLQPDGFYDQSVDMWSVGCIFAEILGRKALFPGKNFLHQLSLIFNIIGAPSPEATIRIQSSQAQRFLKSISKKAKVSFQTLFPTATEAAVDLLERMLEFDPLKRISAQEALEHPYMQEIEQKYRHRGEEDPPPCMRGDFSFDLKSLTKMDLRALIVNEVEHHRKVRSKSIVAIKEKRKKREVHGPNYSNSTSFASRDRMSEMIGQTQEQNNEQNATTVARFGSNRQRIRTRSKPPIPKQRELDLFASNQQEHVKVVDSHSTVLLNRVPFQISRYSENDVKAETMIKPVLDRSQKSLTVARESNQTCLLERTAVSSKPTSTKEHNAQESDMNTLGPSITSNQRTKALTPAQVVSMRSSLVPLHHSQAWETKENKDLEPSASSLSTSSLKDPDVCTELNRVNRVEPAVVNEKAKSDEAVAATIASRRSRRVCSAGTARSKRSSAQTVARRSSSRNAYVGSINSLIQAHRSHNDQSLADLADNMLAMMRQNDELGLSKKENELLCIDALRKRSERFQSKILGLDIVDKKHQSKKLTVPKSPKFSVMSWQKK
ncbi:putative protein kinase [Plasmopara halstedii]